jgi:hypothetical protein
VIIHRVIIEPTHTSPKRQYYKATLDGEVIVSKSADPEFAACRAMKAMGLSGRVEFYRPGVSYPGLIVHDLSKAAGLRVVETETVGPILKKWHPLEEMHRTNKHLLPHLREDRRRVDGLLP